MPGAIQSDNGPSFVSDILKELFSLTQLEHFRTTAYSHEENGIVERGIKTMTNHLRALMYDRELKPRWSTILPMVQRIMNASFHRSIQCAPAELVFSSCVDLDQHILRAPLERDRDKDFAVHHRELLEVQNKLIGAVQNFLQEKDDQHTADGADREAERVQYLRGSYVLVKYLASGRPPSKLHPPHLPTFNLEFTVAILVVS